MKDKAEFVAIVTAATREMLVAMGRDPATDEGVKDTPARVAKAWFEILEGYRVDPEEVLARRFPNETGYDQMVVLNDIEFHSTCEHHLLPFHGRATVGYLPAEGSVVGLSKLARLVHAFARRLQIQERMTMQIAKTLEQELGARGVGVVIHAEHMCMKCRGVRAGGVMTTSALLGVFREDATARAEFFALASKG